MVHVVVGRSEASPPGESRCLVRLGAPIPRGIVWGDWVDVIELVDIVVCRGRGGQTEFRGNKVHSIESVGDTQSLDLKNSTS